MSDVLRYDDPEAADHPFHARYATVTPGVPGRCPECEDFGYIDSADLGRGYQNQHCPRCGHCWSYAFDRDGWIIEVRGLPEVTPVSERLGAPDAVIDLRSRPAVVDAEPAPRQGAPR